MLHVLQRYVGGEMCSLDQGGSRARETELRIACSPDDQQHLLIREPEQCRYVMVLFEPSLCTVPGFGRPPEDDEALQMHDEL